MREPHTCISGELARFEEAIRVDSDEYLIRKMRDWGEFRKPLSDNIRVWRVYCRAVRQEAYRRGIWAPK